MTTTRRHRRHRIGSRRRWVAPVAAATALVSALAVTATASPIQALFGDVYRDHAAGYTGTIGIEITPSVSLMNGEEVVAATDPLVHDQFYALTFEVTNNGNVPFNGVVDLFGYFVPQGRDLNETGIVLVYADANGAHGEQIVGPGARDDVAMPGASPATTGIMAAEVETEADLGVIEPGASRALTYWVKVLSDDAQTMLCDEGSTTEVSTEQGGTITVCRQSIVLGARARARGTSVEGVDLAWSGADRKATSAIAQVKLSTAPEITLVEDLNHHPFVTQVTDANRDEYLRQFATAWDKEDGDLTAAMTIGLAAGDPAAVGAWSATYDVSDSQGSAAEQKSVSGETWRWVQVEQGQYHGLALDSLGRVWGWGYAGQNPIGAGTNTRVPTMVAADGNVNGTGTRLSEVAGRFVDVAAAQEASFALAEDDTIWAWGEDSSGVLGNGSTTGTQTRPIQITLPGGVAAVEVVASFGNNAVALDANGDLWAWGNADYGALGTGNSTDLNTPTLILDASTVLPAGDRIVHVEQGEWGGVAVTAQGGLWVWGRNYDGEIGLGTTNGTAYKPTLVNPPDDATLGGDLAGRHVTYAAHGRDYVVALDGAGRIYTWGSGASGRLANGSTSRVTKPTLVATGEGGVALPAFTFVSASYDQIHAITADGAMWASGYNNWGETWTGTTSTLTRLRPAHLLPGPVSMSYHDYDTSVALAADGTAIWTIGYGGNYEPGDDSGTSRIYEHNVVTLPKLDPLIGPVG